MLLTGPQFHLPINNDTINNNNSNNNNNVKKNVKPLLTPSTIDKLDQIQFKRERCQNCGLKTVFFCPNCFKPLTSEEEKLIPKITLPKKVLIMRRDKPRRNTAAQIKTLAYDHTIIHDLPLTSKDERKSRCYPDIEIEELNNIDKETDAVILYPSENAVTFEEMSNDEIEKLKYIIIIDCPWRRTRAILDLPVLNKIKHVKLKNIPKQGRFWRVPPAGEGYLSTVEALRYAFRELPPSNNNKSHIEETDKLLFFFNHMEIVVNAKRKSLMGNKFVPIADEKYRNAQRQKWFSDSNSSSNNIKGRDDVIEVETNNVMEVDNDKNNIHATNKKPKI